MPVAVAFPVVSTRPSFQMPYEVIIQENANDPVSLSEKFLRRLLVIEKDILDQLSETDSMAMTDETMRNMTPPRAVMSASNHSTRKLQQSTRRGKKSVTTITLQASTEAQHTQSAIFNCADRYRFQCFSTISVATTAI